MKIDTLTFNIFQENTYIVYDETGQALLIDPGLNTEEERTVLDEHVEKNNINVTIRRELGRDIEGACGQLRRRYEARTGNADL